MFRGTDCPYMSIAFDWDVKNQTKQNKSIWYEHQTRKATNLNSFPATGNFCIDVYEDLCQQLGPRSGPVFCDEPNCLTICWDPNCLTLLWGSKLFGTDGILERFWIYVKVFLTKKLLKNGKNGQKKDIKYICKITLKAKSIKLFNKSVIDYLKPQSDVECLDRYIYKIADCRGRKGVGKERGGLTFYVSFSSADESHKISSLVWLFKERTKFENVVCFKMWW